MRKTRFNEFEINDITLVPFRHHSNSLLWMVNVIEGDYVRAMNVVADDSEDAAFKAYDSYQKYLVEEMKYIEWKEQQKEEKEELEQLEEVLI